MKCRILLLKEKIASKRGKRIKDRRTLPFSMRYRRKKALERLKEIILKQVKN
jgi:hypothetical protein